MMDFHHPCDFGRVDDLLKSSTHSGRCLNKGDIEATVKKWLGKTKVDPASTTLRGPEVGRFWTLVFHGALSIGAKNAKAANLALRDDSGEWEKLWVTTKQLPEGSAHSDSQAVETSQHLYVGPDKSPKRVALEKEAKRVSKAIVSQKANAHPTIIRNKGVPFAIHVDFKRAARLVVQGMEVQVHWHDKNLEDLKIEKSKAKEVLAALKVPRDDEGQYSL